MAAQEYTQPGHRCTYLRLARHHRCNVRRGSPKIRATAPEREAKILLADRIIAQAQSQPLARKILLWLLEDDPACPDDFVHLARARQLLYSGPHAATGGANIDPDPFFE